MTEIALPQQASRIGQATAIEQSRAVAEVHAAILVAQRCPRDIQAAIAAMRESCAQFALAERAFYRVPRGGKTASDISVHLARDLARVWGNIQYGVDEMRRDDEHGQSEMRAWAWEVQTNTRISAIFIVPHKRDSKDGPPKPLVDLQAIYENNANAGARRVRGCIQAVLPPWFVEEAKQRCRRTIMDGPLDENGKPRQTLEQRVADVIATFAELRVTEDDLARKLGRPTSRWTAFDLADLIVIGKSIRNGEVTRDEEFPPALVVPAELVGPSQPDDIVDQLQPNEAEAAPPAADPEHTDSSAEPVAEQPTEPADERAPAALVNKLRAELKDLGVIGTEVLHVMRILVGRPLRTSTDITTQEGARVADILLRIRSSDDPTRALDQVLAESKESQQGSGC